MKKYIFFLLVFIIFVTKNSFSNESENEENFIIRDKIENRFFLGISPILFYNYTPFAITDAGHIDMSDGKRQLYWVGKGFILESMYIPSLLYYYNKKNTEYFISINNSLGYIYWDYKLIYNNKKNENKYEIDKGYSLLYIPKLRFNALFYMIGCYFDLGLGFVYYNPKNLEEGEKIHKDLKIGLSYGFGLYLRIPSRHQVIIDFCPSWVVYFNSFDKPNPDNYLMVRFSFFIE